MRATWVWTANPIPLSVVPVAESEPNVVASVVVSGFLAGPRTAPAADPRRAVEAEPERVVVVLVADRPATLVAGVARFGALTDVAQTGDAHSEDSLSGNLNLWRGTYAVRDTRSRVTRSRLVVGLGAVFAGLTVFTTVLGFVYSPVALALAAAFGVTTYFLWYHASGRLRRRVHRDARAAGSGRTGSRGRTRADGFGAGPREEWTGPRGGPGFDADGSRRRDVGGRRRQAGPSTAEAYRALDLEPGADETAVRTAYREKVKEVHPDTDEGSERAFKRVQSAYDHLSD